MALRYYSNTAIATTLAAPINNSDTSMVVSAASGFPGSFPYTLIVDFGLSTSEVVEVTAAAGTTLTITRGVDNTSAQSHGLAAPVVHGISKRDVSEPNSHIAATTNEHGLSGGSAFAGTTQTQTLTNKTMSGASNTFTSLPAAQVTGNLSGVSSVTSSGAISGTTIAGTTITGSSVVTGTAHAATGLTGAVTATRYVGGTATVAPTTGTFITGDYVISANGKLWICTSGGTPGTWVNVASTFLPLGGGTLTGDLQGTTATFSGAVGLASAAVTGATTGRDLVLTGATDTVQLSVKGNGTQTNFLFQVKKSDNTSFLSVDNSGNLIVAGTSTLTGNVIGGTTDAVDCSNTIGITVPTSIGSLTWDTNDRGNAAMHSTASNTSRFIAPRTGRYGFGFTCATGTQTGAGIFDLRIRISGTTDVAADRRTSNSGSNNYANLYSEVYLTSGDYVEARAASSGTTSTTINTDTHAHFHYIGPS